MKTVIVAFMLLFPCILLFPGVTMQHTLSSIDHFVLSVVFHLTIFAYQVTFMHCYFHVHLRQRSVICDCQQNVSCGNFNGFQFSRSEGLQLAIGILVSVRKQ